MLSIIFLIAIVLMAAIAVIAWIVVQLGGGGALLTSLFAFPGCALIAVAIHRVQRWTGCRRRVDQPNPQRP